MSHTQTPSRAAAWGTVLLLAVLSCSCPCPPRPKPPEAAAETCVDPAEQGKPTCLKLKRLGVKENQGGNLQVTFQVTDCQDKAFPDLDVSKVEEVFIVEEDGKPVSTFESQVTILPRQVAARLYTLLLLDLSESVRQGKNLQALQQRALEIVDGLVANQRVAVAAFDGREEIQILESFTDDVAKLKKAIDGLAKWKTVDPSTNLYGAYIAGLDFVKKHLKKLKKTTARGSLILISDGSDQAGRKSKDEALEAGRKFAGKSGPIYAIGVGGETDTEAIKALGITGAYAYNNWAKFDTGAIGKIVREIDRVSRSFFVLSYCSPKRSGRHTVHVKLKAFNGAVAKHEFDASEFSGECNSRWVLTDCDHIECGGLAGSECHKCPEAKQTCHEGRCVTKGFMDKVVASVKAREDADRAAAAEQAELHRKCASRRQASDEAWARYELKMKRYPKRCDRR